MKLTRNIIALQKGFINPIDKGENNTSLVATFQANLMKWGYMLTNEAYAELAKADTTEIKRLHTDVIEFIKDITGGDLDYTPMYKNFPEEVMSKSDIELFFNAILHYWSNGTWMPESIEMERPVEFENINYNMIGYGDDQKFNSIFTSLVSINQSLTPSDMEVIKWFVKEGIGLNWPGQIPFKENLCTLAGLGLDVPVKTTTDVLRIAVSLSGGDISLPKVPRKMVKANAWSRYLVNNVERDNFKFKKFNRKERKYLLNLLNNSNCDVSEMVLKAQRWVRLGEILHPGDYKDKFPRAYEVFTKIRNNKVRSWYSKLNNAFKTGLEDGLKVLTERPGEFARRIDWLVRNNEDQVGLIMMYFKSVMSAASNKVLFELYTHFEKRRDVIANRKVMVKGARKATELPQLDKLPVKVIDNVQKSILETISKKFSMLEALPKCWVDPELKKIPLPTNMRSMSESQKPVIRGQRIPFDNQDAKVIRAFVHWVDLRGREDLDLSATFISENNEQDTRTLSFGTSGLKIGNSCHSGDIRNTMGNCAEYIDVDISDALENGFRYVLLDVHNFNGDGLESVKSLFGMMEREHPQANKVWLPETISNTQKLTSKGSNTLIGVLDLETKEYIMLDLDESGLPYSSHKAEQYKSLIKDYTSEPKFSVYDLVMMHVEARSQDITDDIETAEKSFTYEDFCHSYEKTAELMGV